MAIGSATPGQRKPVNFTVTNDIETYPKSQAVAGTAMTFDPAFPEVVTITSWPYTVAKTMSILGAQFWLFDKVNGCVSYGRWRLVGTTLSFLHCSSYPNFTTTLASGEAYAIPNSEVKNFDQCSIKALSDGVTVNGASLDAIGSIITVEGLGNANYPAIIDALTAGSGTAHVSNAKFIN